MTHGDTMFRDRRHFEEELAKSVESMKDELNKAKIDEGQSETAKKAMRSQRKNTNKDK